MFGGQVDCAKILGSGRGVVQPVCLTGNCNRIRHFTNFSLTNTMCSKLGRQIVNHYWTDRNITEDFHIARKFVDK